MKAKINVLTLLEKYHIKPKDENLYFEAVTHSSYAYENGLGQFKDYERLEFMGDALLQVVSSEFVFKRFPNLAEGKLTKLRSKLVRTESLYKLGKEINLHEMINLGNGEEKDRGLKESIIEDVVEAILGAIYIDQGFFKAKQVALDWLNRLIKEVDEDDSVNDYKSSLQELIQSDSREPLKYVCVKSVGKDNNKTFYYEVIHDDVVLGRGQGKSKKSAEQSAARQALKKLAK